MHTGDDCICIFENVVSEKLCKKYIDIIDEYGVREEILVPGTNVNGYVVPNENNPGAILLMKLQEQTDEIFFNIGHKLKNTFPVDLYGCQQPQFRKLIGRTKLHTDNIFIDTDKNNLHTRVMSVIIALNDYEGGEFYFPIQKKTIKLKKGQAITFPPYWTHPHEVSEPQNGTVRYTINTWLLGGS